MILLGIKQLTFVIQKLALIYSKTSVYIVYIKARERNWCQKVNVIVWRIALPPTAADRSKLPLQILNLISVFSDQLT